jgi:anti-sigma regulatory factor (Ser/Thr protein kinase)
VTDRWGNETAAGGPPLHAVALYESADDLQRRVLPFLRSGLAEADTTVAIVSAEAAAHLKEALGADHHVVRWRLPGVDYQSLGRTFAELRSFLAEQAQAGNSVRLLAENPTASDDGRTAAYLRFEAASNDAMGAFGFPWACLYHTHRYPAPVLEQVTRVHPYLLERDGNTVGSDAYLPPDTFLDANPGPLSPVPPNPPLDIWLTTAEQLAKTRHTAAETAAWLGLPPEDQYDFELATGEVLTNAVRHGERPCRLRVWATSTHVVLRVDDRGPGDDIATKGFRPPDPARGHLGGMGIWMIRQLADAVHVETGSAGTAVEIQFPLRVDR